MLLMVMGAWGRALDGWVIAASLLTLLFLFPLLATRRRSSTSPRSTDRTPPHLQDQPIELLSSLFPLICTKKRPFVVIGRVRHLSIQIGFLEKMEIHNRMMMRKCCAVIASSVLAASRDGFEASLCRTSWPATIGRPSVFEFTGDYEYIDVLMKDSNGGGDETVRLIVDMDFRSQFELARPTSTYLEPTASLPSIFVGSEEKLMEIICLVCLANSINNFLKTTQ
ncbi:hypothetical protein LOK49_LG13G01229 [Camellia lanceoleosa]|uniref:Uncharacterized protein n=1 Tax=Camellia lanceoleosa TaxID=1840588 RepID=A0ACC0FH54_9ERIC|nr:hypothetical protein LOK49_LG13G01229 [Camellia lanceoleosa]